MTVLKVLLIALIITTSVLLVLTILMHRGRGGGLSDMFGGGITQSAQSSGVAERNLTRITVGSLIVWVVCVVAYVLILRYYVPADDSDQSGSESGQSSQSSETTQSSSDDGLVVDVGDVDTTSEE